jgi:hypothetical protein
MDDFRLIDPDAEECWRASRRDVIICNHLGIQDAPRKTRYVLRSPGPWAGSMVYMDDAEAGVQVLVLREKWDNANHLLATLHGLVLAPSWVDHNVLERIRGFLVYMERAYRPLTPLLMGLRMSIDGWRPVRDGEGWIMREIEMTAGRESEDESDLEEPPVLGPLQPPGQVKAAPRLMPDLEVMLMLKVDDDPPLRRVRPKSKINILYFYRDAYVFGFGWCNDFGDGVMHELGEWCESIQEATFNYRELRNLVNAMVRAAREGRLNDCEVLLYIDNQKTERAYFKGTAKSRALFDFIVTLYKLQIEFDFTIHGIWIAGTRMIQNGTGSLSRGADNGFVMCGLSLGGMLPLHLNATERSPLLEDWIRG